MRVAVRDLRVRLASRRFDVIEIFSADRFDEFAVDKVADTKKHLGHTKLARRNIQRFLDFARNDKEGIRSTNWPSMKLRTWSRSVRMRSENKRIPEASRIARARSGRMRLPFG